MTPAETSNLTTVGLEKRHTAIGQGKDFKIAFVNMFKDLREDMNEVYGN